MISETLGNIYASIENKFYSVFDFLENKGLPVYSVIDPIEEKGIPFFPLTIGLIVILLTAIFGFGVIGTDFDSAITVNLKDDYGKGLSSVKITAWDAKGNELFNGTKNNADIITIKVQAGAELTFKAEKEGYDDSSKITIKVINKDEEVSLSLKKIINSIQAKIRFYDEETETTVSNVQATIEWQGIIKEALSDSDGLIEFLEIPLEEDLYITAVADSYYEKTASIRFESDETKSVYLTPKEIAFEGQSNLIITLFDEEGNLIENAKVKVFNALNDELIDEKIVGDGVYSENFPKGMVLRFTAEKEGFKLFESNEFTLRGEEENLGAIELEKGGKEIIVKAIYSDTKNPIVGAAIILFNSKKEIINSSTTLYEGLTEFKGLDVEQEYWIGAEKEGYVPAIKKVESDSEEIELIKANSSNSGELSIIAVDEEENPIANASLFFTQIKGEETEVIPLGTGVKHTDENGKFSLTVPLNSEIFVNAVKDLLVGGESLKIEYPTNNNMLIRLAKKDSVKSIKFFDEKGQILGGSLIIKTKNGETIFEGAVEEEILFDAQGNNFVEIELTTPEGKKYSEEINVEGKTDITVDLDSREINEKTPEIEFLGIYDIAGNEVEGITKGKEYILKFKTEWSSGLESGGLHFRTGSDSIKYADSEDIGITGFDGATNNYFYGRSFTPTPSPGYKEIDYSNSGQGGKLNKFIELYYNNPEGTKIIKVRVKARETISQEIVRIKYRAWSYSDGYHNRNPFDSVLEKAKQTEEKESLYADTEEIEIKVYDSEPECMEEVCVQYKFVSEDGQEFDKKDFFGLKDKVYALEMNLEARLSTTATFKLNTSNESPRIAFTGNEIGSFSQFIDNNKSDTLIEFKSTVSRDGTKARVYFKAKEQGESFIKTNIISPKDSMTENFYFKIFEEKTMEITAPESIKEGQNFEVIVKDEEGQGIENAEITLLNSKGRIEKTIFADEFNGTNGRYSVENNLAPGKYLIKVKSDKFKSEEKEIEIVFGTGLELEPTTEMNIPSGQIFLSKRIEIKNLTENLIENLSAEIIPAGNFPKEFKLSVNTPAVLNSKEENTIELIAEYSGNTNAIMHGEAEIIITGLIKGTQIKTQTKAVINYNQKLDADCLEFDRTELTEYLIGAGGNSKQLELGLKNNCGITLEFELEAIAKGQSDNEIEFSAGRIVIAKDEVKTIKIGVINKIQRNFLAQTNFEYDLFFNSSQLTKSIPVKIILWNEMFALDVSPSIVLWLTQSRKGEQAIAAQSIFIRNTGLADIQNLSFATQFDKPGNTKINVEYAYSTGKTISELKKGMSLIPTPVLQAITDTTENQEIIGKVIVSGVINGKQYALREINVFVNVSSGWSCLEAWSDDMQFYSPTAEFGSIDKTLNIVNNCLEPVIIKGIEPQKIGGNEINLIDSDYVLQPGTKDSFTLKLTKKAETNQKVKLKVVGLGQRSGGKEIYSMPFEAEIAIGKGAGLCGGDNEPCQYENTTTLEYCDAEGTATVFFPKQSTNCGEGYCDAEELGKFLSEKLEEEFRKAQLRISDVKSVENLGAKCEIRDNYCSFGALGISSTSFEFYLKNDNLTDDLLESEMKKLGAKEIQNAFIRYGGTEQDLYSSAGSSFGNHLILFPSIRGCGKYTARIIGAVAINGNEIRSDSISLLLKLEPNTKGEIREETPECNSRIQNFMNFLPVDESYSPGTGNSKGSWLGIIIQNPEIESLQKIFAKTLFKDDKGIRVTANKENNFLRFSKASFDQTKGIVKIAMERTGSSDSPKQLDIFITDKYFNAPEEVEKGIASEAGMIISNLKNGVIEKGCISENMDYLILGEVKNIAELLDLKWTDSSSFINLYPNNYTCTRLKMSSKLDAPEVEVSWDLVSKKLSGILKKETVFKYPNGEEITNKGEKKFSLSKLRWEEAGNNYTTEFDLCFKGTDNPRDAKDSKIKLQATGLKDRTLQFGVCAILPTEFYDKSQQITEKSTWYATVDWEGAPDKVPLQAIRDHYYALNPEKLPENILKKDLSERKWLGVLGYTIGSIVGYAVAAPLTGGTSLGAAVLDLSMGTLPAIAIAAFSSEGEAFTTALNAAKSGLKSIGISAGEIEAIQKETELSDSDFFWEMSKLNAINWGIKETGKAALVTVNSTAKDAAEAAKVINSAGAPELIDELAVIQTDLTNYNEAKLDLKNAGIERIGVTKNGERFIDDATNLRHVEGGAGDFTRKYNDMIKALRKTTLKGQSPGNMEKILDETFKVSTKTATKAEFIVDEIVNDQTNGIVKQLEEWGAKVEAKANPNTVEGKNLLNLKKQFADLAANKVRAGEEFIPPAGATATEITTELAKAKALSAKGKIVSFFEQHPRLKRLSKGVRLGIGQWVGGALGWMGMNALLGPIEGIPTPETTNAKSAYFEKGKTYKVEIGLNLDKKPTYTFSLVEPEDLPNIPADKRLDKDKVGEGICNQPLKPLTPELIDAIKKWEEREANK